jgi:hypothetical protein
VTDPADPPTEPSGADPFVDSVGGDPEGPSTGVLAAVVDGVDPGSLDSPAVRRTGSQAVKARIMRAATTDLYHLRV